MKEAIEKIKAEMERSKADQYIQTIGNYMLHVLNVNPAAAEKIMIEDKTIYRSQLAVEAEAKKQLSKNPLLALAENPRMAMLSEEVVYGIVLQYYGITGGSVPAPAEPVPPAAPVPPPAPVTAPPAFSLELDFGDL